MGLDRLDVSDQNSVPSNYHIPSSAAPFKYVLSNDYSSFSVSSSKAIHNTGFSFVDSVLPCECLPKIGACNLQSSCINGLLFMECNDDCPAGRFCQNKNFANRKYASDLQVFESSGKGCGLRTLSFIPSGSFIMEYVGEILSPDTMARRIKHMDSNFHFYFMTLNSDQIIDASEKGNISRFMNHSCAPNCQTQKWIVKSQMRIGIFAIKDIFPNTELTFDYKFERFGKEASAQPCLCGEPVCKGIIGASPRSRKTSTINDSNSMLSLSSSSSEEDDDHDFDSSIMCKNRLPKKHSSDLFNIQGIENPAQIPLLLKKIITIESVNPLRRQLQILNATTSLTCFKRLLQLHGLLIFKTLLSIYKNEQSITYYILCILDKCPITSSNKIEETEIDDLVKTFIISPPPEPEADEYMVYQLSKSLVDKWSILPRIFKIPKKPQLLENLSSPFSLPHNVYANDDDTKLTLPVISISNDPNTNTRLTDTDFTVFSDRSNHSSFSCSTLMTETNNDSNAKSLWEPSENESSWTNNGYSWEDNSTEISNANTETWANHDNIQDTQLTSPQTSYYRSDSANSKIPPLTSNLSTNSLDTTGNDTSDTSLCYQPRNTDIFSHLLDSTLNSLKKYTPSITTDFNKFPSQNTTKKEKPLRFLKEESNIKDPNTLIPPPISSTSSSCSSTSSIQSPMVLSPIQLQHIIRKATISVSQNHMTSTELASENYFDAYHDELNKPSENLLLDLYREQWAKLLKAPIINIVSSIISRYRNQMDIEMFKKLNRKISHSLLDKETRNKEKGFPPDVFNYDEKHIIKMKQFTKEYLYKLGYKKPDNVNTD